MQQDSEKDNTEKIIKSLIYSDPQADILETTADRVLMHCGVGSGKSQVIGVLSAEFVINNPELTGLIAANTYGQLSNSTLFRVFDVWEKNFGLEKNIHYVVDHIPPENFIKIGSDLKSYKNIISFQNGARIIVTSLENYEAIDGIEIGWSCLDETKDTREEAVKAVIVARLRQKGLLIDSFGTIYRTIIYNKETKKTEDVLAKNIESGKWIFNTEEDCYYDQSGKKLIGWNPLYIFTSPAKTKWLSDWFGLDEDAEEITKRIIDNDDYYRKRKGRYFVVIASTYHNQHNLPPGYIAGLIDDYANDEGLITMNIYGSPFGKTGGEYCTTYSRLTHVGDYEPFPELPLHLAFDFNVVPYITCTLWQYKMNDAGTRWIVRAIDEMCLPNPKNNSEDLSEEIITYYEYLLKNGMFYYGDWNGNTDSTVTKAIRSNYDAIEDKLIKYVDAASDRVVTNKGLEKRRRFVNKIFKGSLPIDVQISKKCKELIADLEFCKEGPDGGKLKSLVEKDGRKFQDRGHCLDSAEYMFTSAFDFYFNQ